MLLSSALAACLPAMSVAAAPHRGSLSVVVVQAWQLHPLAAGLDARAAEADAARSLANSLTPGAASVSLGNLDDRQGRNQGKKEWEVELAVPLWLPGQKNARTAEADELVGEAAARRVAARLAVAGEVRDAWWSLATVRSAAMLAERRLTSARQLAGNVQKRFKVGDLSRIDANLAQGEVLAAEVEAIETRTAALRAEQDFRLLTGVPAPMQLDEESAVSGMPVIKAENGDSRHPQLVAAAASARSARARVKVADESTRAAPELALRVVRERSDFAEPYGNSIGVKLKIPFSMGAQVRRDTSAAQAEAEQADAEMQRSAIRVQMDVERARHALDAAERKLTMAEERRALSADNLQLAEKAFALGETDLATLLRIRAIAFEAENFHERQRIDRALSISRLNQALGVLP